MTKKKFKCPECKETFSSIEYKGLNGIFHKEGKENSTHGAINILEHPYCPYCLRDFLKRNIPIMVECEVNDDKKFLSCPFCGSDSTGCAEYEGEPYVKCEGCGSRGQVCETQMEAIVAWNRRSFSEVKEEEWPYPGLTKERASSMIDEFNESLAKEVRGK